jgi:hypothetical protein
MPLTQHSGGRGRRISEFEASLVYRVSSRTARAIQRNPVSKRKKKKKELKGAWIGTTAAMAIPSYQLDCVCNELQSRNRGHTYDPDLEAGRQGFDTDLEA